VLPRYLKKRKGSGSHRLIQLIRVTHSSKFELLQSTPKIGMETMLMQKLSYAKVLIKYLTQAIYCWKGVSNSISLRTPSSLSAGGVAPLLSRIETESPQTD
jgi:hypothetical protein